LIFLFIIRFFKKILIFLKIVTNRFFPIYHLIFQKFSKFKIFKLSVPYHLFRLRTRRRDSSSPRRHLPPLPHHAEAAAAPPLPLCATTVAAAPSCFPPAQPPLPRRFPSRAASESPCWR
jgi:hypothetical protein